jgi:hypothetical protein
MDDGRVHARFPHLVQQLVPGEGRPAGGGGSPACRRTRCAPARPRWAWPYSSAAEATSQDPSATRRLTGNPASFISNFGRAVRHLPAVRRRDPHTVAAGPLAEEEVHVVARHHCVAAEDGVLAQLIGGAAVHSSVSRSGFTTAAAHGQVHPRLRR